MVFPCDKGTLVIFGENGTGKTSILEALHYLCYLRSFRTYTPKELIQFDQDSFFVKILFTERHDAIAHELQVGFSHKKRIVRMDQRAVASYKELLDYYRVVTITEDDLELIKGTPEYRRSFIDQALFLVDYSYTQELKRYKQLLDNRNALLQQSYVDYEMYTLWTEQLFTTSQQLVLMRKAWLESIIAGVNRLLHAHIDPDIIVACDYVSKNKADAGTYEAFMQEHPGLYDLERRFKRTLFGIHLDDIQFSFQGKRSRAYASRGQQKLITLLIKIAQIQAMKEFSGTVLFLLDDFMTDFDEQRSTQLFALLDQLDCQRIFTTPSWTPFWESLVVQEKAHRLIVTNRNL